MCKVMFRLNVKYSMLNNKFDIQGYVKRQTDIEGYVNVKRQH